MWNCIFHLIISFFPSFCLLLSLFVQHWLGFLLFLFWFWMTGWCDDENEASPGSEASEWNGESTSSGSLVADADFEVMPTEVRVAAGTTAYLSCRPRSLRNKTVIWTSVFIDIVLVCVCYIYSRLVFLAIRYIRDENERDWKRPESDEKNLHTLCDPVYYTRLFESARLSTASIVRILFVVRGTFIKHTHLLIEKHEKEKTGGKKVAL